MSILQHGARVGAATIVVGFSLAWPQAVGVASADKPGQDSASVSAGPAKSGTATRPPGSNAARPSGNAPAAGATRGRTAATAAASAHSTAAARSAPAANQTLTETGGRTIESAFADAVLSAIGITRPDPASTAGTTTASAAVATVAVTDDAEGRGLDLHRGRPGHREQHRHAHRAQSQRCRVDDQRLLLGLVGSVQSLVEGVGLLVRRFLFNQAPTLEPVQTTGQTVGVISGSLNAVDPEDDKIIYTYTQPAHGQVTIDSNGNYTYDTRRRIHRHRLVHRLRERHRPSHQSAGPVPARPRGCDGVGGPDRRNPQGGLHLRLRERGAVLVERGPRRLGDDGGDLRPTSSSSSPVVITYSVTGQRTFTGTTLASAGSDLVSTDPGFYDTVVQEKILTGIDANGTAPDGQIDWNFGYSWALGDSVASNQYDFQSTAMHELLHSFGFLSVVDSAGNNTGTNWTTFDSYVVTSNGTPPINHTTYSWNTAYNTNLTGGAGGRCRWPVLRRPARRGRLRRPSGPAVHAQAVGVRQFDVAPGRCDVHRRQRAADECRDRHRPGYQNTQRHRDRHPRRPRLQRGDPPQTLAIFIIGFAFMRRRRRSDEHRCGMTDSTLSYERRGAIAIVAIDAPPHNPMSLAFMDALESLVGDIAADPGIRSVVMTAAGEQNFSVGMNLKQLVASLGDRARLDAVLDQRLRVLAAIENMDKPWIATLFGNCLGGGLELPLACHFRLAAQDGARIGLPELHLGSVPAWGGSARLARRVGRDRAVDLILRAKTLSGPEALEIGLVNEVWPNAELKQRAIDLAEELAAMPRVSVATMLRCLVTGDEKTARGVAARRARRLSRHGGNARHGRGHAGVPGEAAADVQSRLTHFRSACGSRRTPDPRCSRPDRRPGVRTTRRTRSPQST